jgi:hypothetical protein
MRRIIGLLGAAIAIVALMAAPAIAATDIIDATNVGNVLSVPASTNATIGDTVRLLNNGASGSFTVEGDATCGNSGGLLYGTLSPGQIVTLGTFSTPTHNVGDVLNFSIGNGTDCVAFTVTLVAAAPPPDVPEAAYAVALVLIGAALFGAGFYVTRRRRSRIAA